MSEDPRNTPDRRAARRLAKPMEVLVSTPDIHAIPVTALNVSASGMYIVCPSPLGDLTRLGVRIPLEEADIEMRAVVIREEERGDGTFGVGLFFTRISLDDRKRITEMVDGEPS